MTRSPDSLIPFDAGRPASEKRDDKAFNRRQEGEANLRAATEVNVVSASLTPPATTPIRSTFSSGVSSCGRQIQTMPNSLDPRHLGAGSQPTGRLSESLREWALLEPETSTRSAPGLVFASTGELPSPRHPATPRNFLRFAATKELTNGQRQFRGKFLAPQTWGVRGASLEKKGRGQMVPDGARWYELERQPRCLSWTLPI